MDGIIDIRTASKQIGLSDDVHDALFDDGGWPKDLPATGFQFVSTLIPADTASWLQTQKRVPIANVVKTEFQGRPLAAPSLAELTAIFPAGSSAPESTAPTAGAGSSITASAPAPSAAAASSQGVDPNLLLALKREDEFLSILFSSGSGSHLQKAVRMVCAWALGQLKAKRWPTCNWPVKSGGTPFEVKLTKATAAQYGVNAAWYFELVPVPMDLSRMAERLDKGTYEQKGLDTFFADVDAIARFAKIYNGPRELQDKSTPDSSFPHPSSLGPEYSVAHGSIYGMAWELQDMGRQLRQAVTAALPIAVRLLQRRDAKAAAVPLGERAAWYTAAAQQAVLAAATRAVAGQAGVPSDLLRHLMEATAR